MEILEIILIVAIVAFIKGFMSEAKEQGEADNWSMFFRAIWNSFFNNDEFQPTISDATEQEQKDCKHPSWWRTGWFEPMTCTKCGIEHKD